MADCLFCKIIRGEIPSATVYEDDVCIALLDIFPITKGHTLILPKRHDEAIEHCESTTLATMMLVAQRLNIAVREQLGCEGVMNMTLTGAAAGQEIFHAHIHVIPRWKGDGFRWVYPERYHQQACPPEELTATAALIKSTWT